MAKITNAFETRDAKGNREDLSDAIYNIDPSDTPFMNTIGRRNVTNVNYDWQTEELPTVDAANAQEEGFELSRTASQPTVRRSNTAQISKRDATVSGSQETSNAAGKAGEMAHQMALKSKALKNDIEKIALSAQARDTGLDDGIRRTRGFAHWLATNVIRGSGGAAPASETAAETAGTQRALTEALVRKAMQTAYQNGAQPSVLMVGPVNKLVVSSFTGRTNTRHAVDATKAVSNVTVYASDFGDVKVVVNRWQRETDAILLDPEYARLAFYRNFRQVPLAKIGDAETRMIVAEWGVQVDNEKAHALIADCFDTNAEYGL